MTIGKKITLTSGILVGLSATLGSACLINVARIIAAVQTVTSTTIPGLGQMQAMTGTSKDQKIAMLTHISSGNPQQMAKAEAKIAESETALQESLAALDKIISGPSDRTTLQEFKAAHNQLLGIWGRILPLSQAGKNAEAFAIWTNEAVPAGAKTADTTARLMSSFDRGRYQQRQFLPHRGRVNTLLVLDHLANQFGHGNRALLLCGQWRQTFAS